jgi:hypothetical protein
MAPLPATVTVLSKLSRLLSRQPLLTDLDLIIDVKDPAIYTMQSWDWDPVLQILRDARCRIKLIMTPECNATTQGDAAFSRLMLRPMASIADVSIAYVALTGGDACVEVVTSGLRINVLHIIKPENNQLVQIKDALASACECACKAGRIQRLSLVLRRGHGQHLSWACPRFQRAIQAIPFVSCNGHFAGFPDDVRIAALICSTLHIGDKVALDTASLTMISCIVASTWQHGSRLEYLVLNNAPTSELMRQPLLMSHIRSIKPTVGIMISCASLDSGSGAFIQRMCASTSTSTSTSMRVGIFWPPAGAELREPLTCARIHLAIIRAQRAFKATRAPQEEQARFFILGVSKFPKDTEEDERKFMAMLPEDERALYMF